MPEPKEYARRLVKGSAIIFTALVVAGIFGLVLRMFLARSLSVFDYGLFYLVFTLVSFFILFRDLGLNSALTKFIPEFMIKKQFDKVKSLIVITTLFQILFALPISLVLILFSDQIAIAIAGTASASVLIKIFGVWFFVMLFFHVFRSAFQGFQDPVPYAAMEIFYILLTSALVVLSISVFNLGVIGAALAYLIGAIILVIAWWGITWKRQPKVFREKVQVEKPLVKKMFKFALPVFIGSTAGLVLGYTDTLMIGIFRGPTEVGLYQAAQPLTFLISYFAAALCIVLLPMISEIWAKREKELLAQAMHSILKFSTIIIIPAVFVFMALPDVILRSFFGPSYVLAAVTFQILTAAVIASTLFSILQSIAAGIGKPMVTTVVVGVMACLNFITNLIFIPIYGIVGAAVTTFVSGLVGLILLNYLLRKSVKFTVPIASLSKTILAGLLTLLFILVLKPIFGSYPWWFGAIIVVVLSLPLYIGLILVMKIMSKGDLELLDSILPIPKRLVKIFERFVK